MNRFLTCIILWVIAGSALAGDAAPSDTAGPDRQILVLLQMPPDHFRLGSSYSGGYGDGAGHGARRRVAAQLAREHGLDLSIDWPVSVLGVDCYVMNVPPDKVGQREALVSELGRDPRVAWVQPMNVFRGQAHNDPLYGVQPAAAEWHLAELHEVATGRQVRIAVVDSGIEPTHPDLEGQIELSENFVADRPFAAERHGTEVAGIIAARADNGVGIAGVAPNARLLALRACWQEQAGATLCTSLSLARALDFAITRKVEVVNLSLGGPPDRLLGGLLDAALRRGIAIVAAVDRTLPGGGFPASHPGVIAVADEGHGPVAAGVILAPGRDVPTTSPPSQWTFVSGSSFAAAHVSGLLALLGELNATGPVVPVGVALARLPTGAIDACRTLARGREPCVCSCDVSQAALPLTSR